MIGENYPPLAAANSSAVGEDLMKTLRSLDREQLLEILSERFCQSCHSLMLNRIRNLTREKSMSRTPLLSGINDKEEDMLKTKTLKLSLSESSLDPSLNKTPLSPDYSKTTAPAHSLTSSSSSSSPPKPQKGDFIRYSKPDDISLNDGIGGFASSNDDVSLEEKKEQIRFSQVGRKKDFQFMEKVDGKTVNILQGLELHTGVFNSEEQGNIVDCIYKLQRMGQNGRLRDRTYSEPRKWMRGKGRVTMQFGCCYNYAMDKNGNPPGIIRAEEVDPIPPLLKKMIKRMVRWQVLPPTCIPDSCIVNIYEEGDCIPPHVDHHDFLRPFCTVSFLTECNILFGTSLKVAGPGDFSGPYSMPLPLGSVLILNGNGADVAKHCIPAVPAKRISITFRKMDPTKIPDGFSPERDLQGIKPLFYSPPLAKPGQSGEPWVQKHKHGRNNAMVSPLRYEAVKKSRNEESFLGEDDFPPLGGFNSANRVRKNRPESRR